ncbi:glutathione hydrolase 7-like isoform X2 [Vespa mandarinia]|uniref:glutathione hydrolase 7-like isoform X2 n=1 Tax=Vespa mandarinia TaxID=7446 RepID=UPI00160A80E3|nr:glutathione hydrolase 7-like isoform X2 [Vespa mandarinia]
MSYCDRQGLTEECPLTQDKNNKCKLSHFFGGGMKLIVCCFAVLSFAITTILILQLVYASKLLQIGTKILRKGGNAIDAAIAATVCMTVVAPHKTGLGGGGCMMLYSHKDKSEPLVINFANNTVGGIFGTIGMRLPAVLKGLEFAHVLKGVLPWNEIIEPAAKLARTGFVVSKELEYELSNNSDYGMLYGHINAGGILKLNDLADTLDAVAKNGTIVLYNGTLSLKLLRDEVKKEELLLQLAHYKPEMSTAKKISFYKHLLYYPSGAFDFESSITALENLKISPEIASKTETMALVAQTLLHSNLRTLEMIKNVEEERYTGVMVMDGQDTYVSVLTGLSAPLGLAHMTGTGFLLDKTNNDNDLSTLLPIIFHNEEKSCELRGVLGTDDTILSSQLLYHLIVRGLNVSSAIEHPRYYLLSDGVSIENDQLHILKTVLQNKSTSISNIDASSISKSVNAIIKHEDLITSHSDSRGGGLASRF